MLPALAHRLPIPHLFMAVSIVACLAMVAAMLGSPADVATDVPFMGAVGVEGDRVMDAQGR